MKVTFVSNYMNHHQQPFSEAMQARLGEDYTFIQTQPMEEERVQMGWDTSAQSLSFVRKFWEEEETCRQLILDSDVVIFGWTGMEELIVPRLRAGKLTFRNSERIYKEGQWKALSPRGLKQKYRDYIQYRKTPYYLLCAGGYVASDFALIHSFPHKMFRWGYFPPEKTYEETFLQEKQQRDLQTPVEILWAGRFIDWKHPETAVQVAAALKEKKIPFHLTMVGGGEMQGQLVELAKQKNVTEQVTFTGFQRPEQVRHYMEKAQIFLFTSDYQEGWGAVLNEAMNSGCAVVVNHALGAAPYLMQHGKNGLVYQNGYLQECIDHTLLLAGTPKVCEQLAQNAYATITKTWNAGQAAEHFLKLCENLLVERKKAVCGEGIPSDGPGSPAPVIPQRKMYRIMTENVYGK